MGETVHAPRGAPYEANTFIIKKPAQETQCNYLLITGTGAILLLLAGNSWFYIKAKKQQIENLRLKSALEIQQSQAEQLICIQNRELKEISEIAVQQQRQKIARDLHDGFASTLAGLRFFIADIRKSNTGTEQRVKEIEAEVADIYNQVREYIYSLHNDTTTTYVDLVKLLENLTAKYSGDNGLRVELNKEIYTVLENIPSYMQEELYFIIKEAVANTVKHAQATLVRIALQKEERSYILRIEDNGTGLPQHVLEGIGLKSMKNRVRQGLKGSFDISSSEGNTCISIIFPAAH